MKHHTVGLGNVEEGKIAEKVKPKRKKARKRVVMSGAYKNIN